MALVIKEPKALQIKEWGPGISDLRFFSDPIFTAEDLKDPAKAAQTYNQTGLDKKGALEAIRLSVAKCQPGIILASNPHYGNYARWNSALVASGFRQIGTCAVNRVYAKNGWTWKGGQNANWGVGSKVSPDGFGNWTHGFFLIKEGYKKVAFDFSQRRKAGGDDLESLFQVTYSSVVQPKPLPSGHDGYESAYARLSKNCGAAMGMGLPTAGVDKLFSTVMGWPADKILPVGWTRFAVVGDLKFAHNHRSLDSAQPKCPHSFDLI